MNRCSIFCVALGITAGVPAEETLYNGIVLSEQWPPNYGPLPHEPMPVAYLRERPKVIPTDVGRQLFVDDFLIESTTMKRTYCRPVYHPANPILTPDKPWESHKTEDVAMPYSDGVWYDIKDKLFKMWYFGGSSR